MSTWPDRPHLLASYAYVKGWGKDMNLFNNTDLLVDSGAFTAATKGTSINLGEYCDWLLGNHRHIKHAAVLDVIGDWRATAENHERMLARLGNTVHVLPAWHLGSPLPELHRLCREHGYIAIGGCVPYAAQPKVLMANLVKVHQVAREHGTKLHGLGITGSQSLLRLPWHTADSSSWAQGYRFGTLKLARPNGTKITVQFGQSLNREEAAIIRAYDGDPSRFSTRSFCTRKHAETQAQYDADRLWAGSSMARTAWVVEGVLQKKHGTDLNIYLADSAPENLAAAKYGHGLGHPYERKQP